MKNNSLTGRVTWALVAAVAVFVGLVAVLAFSVMLEQEDELADQLVQIESHRTAARIASGDLVFDHQPIELGPRLQAWLGAANEQIEPAELRRLGLGLHEIEARGVVLHALVSDTSIGQLTVVFDATMNEDRVSEFGMILMALWLFCVIASIFVAKTVAHIVVDPIQDVTGRISGWDPDSGHDSSSSEDDDSEAGQLIAAFNRMQDRVDASIAREREFAANLSHEIRTPLAALRTDLEMVSLDPRLDDAQRQRVSRAMLAVDEIGSTIAAARTISQAQAMPRQTVFLAQLVDEAWNALRERGLAARLDVINLVLPEITVVVDRYALLIVVRNLLRNAIEHAVPATLTISASDAGLSFVDDGPGIAPSELPFVFERYRHGRRNDSSESDEHKGPQDQHGLGLAIARRICDQQGWRLGVDSRTEGVDRGTRFILGFDVRSTSDRQDLPVQRDTAVRAQRT